MQVTQQVSRLLTLDTAVTTRDGVGLATDVTVRDDGVPRPALLLRTPYSRSTGRQTYDAVGLARRGWAVVVQDVRGRFESGGHFEPFVQECLDGADTVAWCAAQPWCDGRVAMTGWSYCGATQWMAALARPPALGAINPIVSGGHPTASWLYQGGAFQVGLAQPWAVQLAVSEPGISESSRELISWLASEWQRVLRLPHGQDPVSHVFPAYGRWLHPEAAATDGGPSYADLAVPAIQIAGWYDLFCESALDAYVGITTQARDERARTTQRLVVGPWSHSGMLSNLHPEFDFGGAGNGALGNLAGRSLDWMLGAMSGEEVETGVLCFVMGSNVWREYAAWPPPTVPLQLHLSSGDWGARGLRGDGRLTSQPSEVTGGDRVHYDPEDPVPTRGGRVLGPFLPLAGPVDQRTVEARPDVLVYTGEPLEQACTVIGMVTAALTVSSDASSFDVCVKLVDVHPDERAFTIVDSIRRLPAGPPGAPRPVEVSVGSTAHTFLAGHRVRIEVAGSNFPRFDRNPSTGEPAGTATVLRPAMHRVHWGGRSAAVVTLPVLPNPV